METIYFTTSNFIRHQGNVVDLTEYRRKLAQATAPKTEVLPQVEEVVTPRQRTDHRRYRPGMLLDCVASLALIITALTFTFAIL